MDIISFNEAATANGRIEKFIKDPDSTSGIVTVPKTIASGETVTIPAGRVAVLPNVQVDGEIVVEGDGEIFIPAGATLSGVVELDGDQTISEVKTFLESPIVPTPTTGTQAVNKDYADLKVALAAFTGANQNLTTNGYQKLPGGLIIQWGGSAIDALTGKWISFPISFPNGVFSIAISNQQGEGQGNISIVDINLTHIFIHNQYGGSIGAKYIIIGY